MAISFVQAATPVNNASGLAISITYNNPSVANNLLVFSFAGTGNLGPVTSVTATSSTTHNAVPYGQSDGGASNSFGAIYYAIAGASTTVTWTANLTTGTGGSGVLYASEWSGVNTTTPLDQADTGWTNSSAVGTTATGTTLTPGNANELGICVLFNNQSNTLSALSFSGGYSQRGVTTTQGSVFLMSVADQVLSGSPSTTAGATWTGANQWGIAQALFVPAAAVGGAVASPILLLGV